MIIAMGACETLVIIILSVFMSPETIVLKQWKKLFADKSVQKRVCIVAIDEAHCIVEWLVYFITTLVCI